jgi:hypothetical protein
MGYHQSNYYIREKARNYIKMKGFYLQLSGGSWGVTCNIHDLQIKLDAKRLPVIYIAFNFPYKKKLIPIHLRNGRSKR